MTDNLKKYRVIVGERRYYEATDTTVLLTTALNGGGTIAMFGAPGTASGGPLRAQLVDVIVNEIPDTEGGISSRTYIAHEPVAGGLDFSKIADGGPVNAAAREAYVKPADYIRKASTVADAQVQAEAALA